MGIEHMGGQAPVHRQLVVSQHKLVQSQRRNPADFPDRCLRFRRRIVRQAAFEIAQDGIPGLPTRANDIGKAELRPVGIVDALECFKFGIREPVEADAVLLGIGFGREARGALGLVGKIRMHLDQRQTLFGRRVIDHLLHRGEQCVDARERAGCSRLFGDPR